MENFEDRIETEEKTTVKKKWSPPARKKIKTGNTLGSQSNAAHDDGTGAPGTYTHYS